jgi:hypothetical protein
MIDRNAPFREPDPLVCAMCDGTGVHDCPGGCVAPSPIRSDDSRVFGWLSNGTTYIAAGPVDAAYWNEHDWDLY